VLYNPLEEPLGTPTNGKTQTEPIFVFPEAPVDFTDRAELDRAIANNAGPPNVGPTIVVCIKRDGMRHSTLEVEVALSATIRGLKHKLRALTGMLVREQRLWLGKVLIHPDLKISALSEELLDGNNKSLILSKRNGPWRIDVEAMDGRIYAFDFGPKDYVADLEDAALEKIFNGIDRKFHLLNGGHRLRRPSTLIDSGIRNGHKVRLVLNTMH